MDTSGSKVTQAMILAAGLGTRLKPWTDHHPKALAPVNGKPLLQLNVQYLQQAGIYDVIVNVHHFADQIMDAVATNQGWGSRITLSDERDMVLETGGGLKKAAGFFRKGNFVLMNADILTDMNLQPMIDYHHLHQPLATIAVRNRQTSRYFLVNREGTLCGWENVQTGEQVLARPGETTVQKAFSGIHVISTEIFPLLTQEGRFSMVDVYLQLAKTHTVLAFDHSYSSFIDVGTPAAIERAETVFSR